MAVQPMILAGLFGSIGMLAWASVAMVPLLIHLWNRRQHHEANWAAMEFLLAAIQEQSKRLRFEQLLLLLLRMAIPCVLAIALADPLWQLLASQGSSLGSRPPHHHSFLIDTSYSMRYEVDGQTRLEQAKQFARDVIQQSPQGDGFTLLRMSTPSSAVVASPAYAKADILAEIDALTIRDCMADLSSGIDLAKQTLKTTRETQPRLEKHRLYVISDFGQNTWQASDLPPVRAAISDIESLAQIIVADVGVAQTKNLALVSAHRGTTLPTVGSTQSWTVSARSWHDAATSCDVEMRIDGQLTEKRTIKVAATQLGTAAFNYRFDTPGQHLVSFHLPDDAIATDNERFEVVAIRESINVLCIEGRAGSARNIALALSPANDALLQVRTVSDHQFSHLNLNDFDVLFLCNCGSTTSEQATNLRDFLRQGGGIVMFLGDQSQLANHNKMLGQTNNDEPLLPAKLLSVAPYGRYTFSPEDYRHPLIEPFRGQEEAGLLSTPVWSYVRVQPREETTSRVVLAFRNGDPAILEHSVCGGRLALVTTAPSPRSVLQQAGRSTPWNAWSVWPSFPPIVQELLAYSLAGQDEGNNIEVGQAIGGDLPANDVSDYVTVVAANGTEHRVAVQESISLTSWNWNNTHTSGFYSAQLADSDASQQFAVNVSNYDESKPDRVSLASLPNQLQQNSIEVSGDESTPKQLEAAPLFRKLLGVLLALLLTESTVAWYFGNARA